MEREPAERDVIARWKDGTNTDCRRLSDTDLIEAILDIEEMRMGDATHAPELEAPRKQAYHVAQRRGLAGYSPRLGWYINPRGAWIVGNAWA